jgi:class 3 adenylate cyclase
MSQKSERMVVISIDLCRYSEITAAQTATAGGQLNPLVSTNAAIHDAIHEPLKKIARDNDGLRYFIKATGDGALVFFPADQASLAIEYVAEFQYKAEVANRKILQEENGSDQIDNNWFRFYRVGCAVGPISIYVVSKHAGADFAGVVIADSVRIESTGRAGEILISEGVYAILDKTRKKKFGRRRRVAGKHRFEKYVVRTIPPKLIAPWERRRIRRNRIRILVRVIVLALIPLFIYGFRTPIAIFLISLP